MEEEEEEEEVEEEEEEEEEAAEKDVVGVVVEEEVGEEDVKSEAAEKEEEQKDETEAALFSSSWKTSATTSPCTLPKCRTASVRFLNVLPPWHSSHLRAFTSARRSVDISSLKCALERWFRVFEALLYCLSQSGHPAPAPPWWRKPPAAPVPAPWQRAIRRRFLSSLSSKWEGRALFFFFSPTTESPAESQDPSPPPFSSKNILAASLCFTPKCTMALPSLANLISHVPHLLASASAAWKRRMSSLKCVLHMWRTIWMEKALTEGQIGQRYSPVETILQRFSSSPIA